MAMDSGTMVSILFKQISAGHFRDESDALFCHNATLDGIIGHLEIAGRCSPISTQAGERLDHHQKHIV